MYYVLSVCYVLCFMSVMCYVMIVLPITSVLCVMSVSVLCVMNALCVESVIGVFCAFVICTVSVLYTGCSGKIVFFHNSLQPIPRLHSCKRPSKLSTQC